MIKNIGYLILFLTSVYHLLAGVFVLGPKTWVQGFGKKTYNLDLPDVYEPRYEINLRYLGLLAISFSVLLFAIHHLRNDYLTSVALWILGVSFIARAMLRLVLKKEFKDGYNLEFKRSLYNIAFNILLGIATTFCGLKIYLGTL